MNWIQDVFHTQKPIIAMLHLAALPGDPLYDPKGGMDDVISRAREDLHSLQDGGVDAIMFSNESSLPYLTEVEPVTTAAMALIIGELRQEIRVPFGVNVLWDPMASIDLAVVTQAAFVREIFTGVYASDFGFWNTNCGKVVRHRRSLHGQNIRLLFNIVPEAASYLGSREVSDIALSTVFNAQPDALCISGLTAGKETSSSMLTQVKKVVPNVPVFANTGVKLNTLEEQLFVADGAVVGTAFKTNGYIWNKVEKDRVTQFMDRVKEYRQQLGISEYSEQPTG